jgi:hypothetical protein
MQQDDVAARPDLADGDLHFTDRHRPHVMTHTGILPATTRSCKQ